MLKRITAVCLSLILALALAVPALAAEKSFDAELAEVTSAVKQLLEIDDSYTEFNANPMDNSGRRFWDLSWRKEGESVDVTYSREAGVMSYYRDVNKTAYRESGFAPAFPAVSVEDAKEAAAAFAQKLLRSGETLKFNDAKNLNGIVSSSSYYFSGEILLKGLRSPISFTVRVNSDTKLVTGFSRQEPGIFADVDIPSAVPAVSAEKAASILSDTVKLKLQYVMPEDGKGPAVLRYVPVYTGSFALDAATGSLIDLNELDYSRGSAFTAMGAADESAQKNAGLTETELKTIAGLDGVLAKEKLDTALRGINGLGLDSDYMLDSASYWTDSDGNVLCRLAYVKKGSGIKGGAAASKIYIPENSAKYITVDARTAALKSLWTNGDTHEGNSALSEKVLADKALAFITNNFGTVYPNLIADLEQSNSKEARYRFCDSANAVPFPDNAIHINLDPHDGTVSSLNVYWNDDVEFAPAEINADADTALATYLSAFKPVLQYICVPLGDEYGRMKLQLSYRLETEKNVLGVDAKSGELIYADSSTFIVDYTDLEGAYGKAQIETLAKYGIGLPGGIFAPWNQTTQKDALILLLSADGYLYGDTDNDIIYELAYSRGFLTPGEKAPEMILSRIDFIKLLVSATKYGPSAELRGVFAPGYADDGVIPQELMGYAAVAKALGIANGDQGGRLDPYGALSHQDAAIMLYNYMAR